MDKNKVRNKKKLQNGDAFNTLSYYKIKYIINSGNKEQEETVVPALPLGPQKHTRPALRKKKHKNDKQTSKGQEKKNTCCDTYII